MDEKYTPYNHKGTKIDGVEPKHRGTPATKRGLSNQQICIITAIQRFTHTIAIFNVNVEPLCSILIHIIRWRTREMTEHTEKDVLMKCTKCGYEEKVPRWLIDELFPNEPEENYMMHCPECDHKMIVKK